jgi:hypothetical protein
VLSDKFFWHGYIPFYESFLLVEIFIQLLSLVSIKADQSAGYWRVFRAQRFMGLIFCPCRQNGQLIPDSISNDLIRHPEIKFGNF